MVFKFIARANRFYMILFLKGIYSIMEVLQMPWIYLQDVTLKIDAELADPVTDLSIDQSLSSRCLHSLIAKCYGPICYPNYRPISGADLISKQLYLSVIRWVAFEISNSQSLKSQE